MTTITTVSDYRDTEAGKDTWKCVTVEMYGDNHHVRINPTLRDILAGYGEMTNAGNVTVADILYRRIGEDVVQQQPRDFDHDFRQIIVEEVLRALG